MTYYIIDLILLIVSAVIVFRSWRRGFLQGFFSFARFAITLVLVMLLVDPVSGWIDKAFLHEPIYNGIYDKTNEIYQNAQGNVTDEDIRKEIPGFLLTDEIKSEINSVSNMSEAWPAAAAQKIASPLSHTVATVIAYVVLFLTVFFLLAILIKILSKLVDSLPIIGHLNRLLGLIWGILVAVCICVMISSVIKALWGSSPVYTQSVFVKFFGESFLLEFLTFLDIGKNLLSISPA